MGLLNSVWAVEKVIGRKVIRLEEVSSTNDYAKSVAREVPDGTLIVARRQTSGRGRLGRRWLSPEGGMVERCSKARFR